MSHSQSNRPGVFRQYYEIIVFLLGTMIGLFYVFIIPPWQHYDEPTHLEYAWLIANRPQLIETGGYVQSLRREIAASMIEHNFYKISTSPPIPNLLIQNVPIWIGISQTGDKSIYHWLVGLPLRLLGHSDIETQLHSTRLVSLIFYLVTLWAGIWVAKEITPLKSHLRWALPISLVLIPGIIDLNTAVNNDVGATTFFSLFIWASLLTIKNGLNFKRFATLIILAGICYLTKNTVSVAIILVIVPLCLGLFRQTEQRNAWFALLVIFLLGLLAIFSWGDAAHWSRDKTFQTANTQTINVDAPMGIHAFQMTRSSDEPSHFLNQFLPYKQVQSLQGKDITLGAWIWTDKSMSVQGPILGFDEKLNSLEIEIDEEKHFYAFTIMVPADTLRLYVSLTSQTMNRDVSGTIFFDGVILAEGKYDTTKTPIPDNIDVSSGKWGDKPFINLLSNASAEQSGPRLRLWSEKIIAKNYPGNPSLILTSILDWKQASWYYLSVSRNLFTSFWAKFSWGQVRLPGRYTYWVLLIVTLSGIVGTILRLIRQRRVLPWPILFFLISAVISVWGPTMMRGINSLLSTVFIPTARYAYPAIIPTMLILIVGWQEISKIIHEKLHIPVSVLFAGWILFWLSLNGLAIFTIYNYFYS